MKTWDYILFQVLNLITIETIELCTSEVVYGKNLGIDMLWEIGGPKWGWKSEMTRGTIVRMLNIGIRFFREEFEFSISHS